MKPFATHTGRALPLDRSDVDTDQIVPAEHLKRIERSGFGPFLFAEWRKDPDFVLNRPEYRGATILLAGANFGSGSSREHAVWALEDAGFRVVIAPSFADIFRNNCSKIGLVAVELATESVRALMDAVIDDPSTEVTVDLQELKVTAPAVRESFEIDPYTRWRLLEGLDDIGLTLRHDEAIASYEEARPARLPSVRPGVDAPRPDR
jgi:3-isopropylmalate/(R)-2-methylmalate dehydratase small subunit